VSQHNFSFFTGKAPDFSSPVAAKHLQAAVAKQEDQRVRTRAGFSAGQVHATGTVPVAAGPSYQQQGGTMQHMPALQPYGGSAHSLAAQGAGPAGPGYWAQTGQPAAPVQPPMMYSHQTSSRPLPMVGQMAAAQPVQTAPNQAGDAAAAVAQFIGMIQQMYAGGPVASGSGGHMDPEAKMAKALDELRLAPVELDKAFDDRCLYLHPARFLAGPVCSVRQLWLLAREVIGLGPLTALSGYDLETLGLDGCVTTKGWVLIHDPANPNQKLKHFSSVNVGSSSLNTKRLTLADGDGSAVDVSDSLRDILSLEDYKNSLRTLSKAMHLALPWNHSINAIEGFMASTNFCAKELGAYPNRPHLLAVFTDHVLNANSKRWINKQEFLGAAELRLSFDQWAGSRSLNMLTAKESGAGEQSKKFSYNKKFGQNFTGQPAKDGEKSARDRLCRRYNAGNCPNSYKDCVNPNDKSEKLQHYCSYEDSRGRVCRGKHSKVEHHKYR